VERKLRQGGCLCGAVRFTATGDAGHVNLCHCRMCRKAGGAPVVAWATFPSAQVAFSTPPRWHKSSEAAERAFCPTCGSALAWREFANQGEIDLTVGTFDDADDLKPADHLWMDASIRWLKIDDHLPRYHTTRKGALVKG